MATSYTSILKLALPTQGELDGTWGTVVNDNITSMVEEAVAGMKTIDTWTTNSHTLTTANGTTAESRAAILKLTDTTVDLGGAGTLIVPDATKIYVVNNGTGQTITVKTSAGTGIAIADAATTIVYCDAVNVLSAVTALVTATATTEGIVELATQAEADGDTGGDRVITSDVLVDYGGNLNSLGQITADSYVGGAADALTGTTPAIDCSAANFFYITLTGNTTFSFSSVPTTVYQCMVEITGASTYTITWPGTLEWAGGSAPAAPATGTKDLYRLVTRDGGTSWYGILDADDLS